MLPVGKYDKALAIDLHRYDTMEWNELPRDMLHYADVHFQGLQETGIAGIITTTVLCRMGYRA
jgi:hypothetical protein